MTVRVLEGDCRAVLAGLAPRSVHVCVTSPPYWGLRAYGTPPQAWGSGWVGELGSEPTLELFVRHLVEVFAAVGRVLRDDGTLWVNLGDSYSTHAAGKTADPMKTSGLAGVRTQQEARDNKTSQPYRLDRSLPEGNLCMAPARFALAMQEAGWRLRSEITLCKTAPMPESVQGVRFERCKVKVKAGTAVQRTDERREEWGNHTPKHGTTTWPTGELAEWVDCPGCPKCAATDGQVQRWGSGRPTSATEKLYVFAKGSGPYFYDIEAVRQPVSAATLADGRTARGQRGTKGEYGAVDGNAGYNPAGRNLWNYVMWAPEPLQAAHYAAYPRWLPRLAIQAGTSDTGVCPGCGAPWLRVVDRRFTPQADVRDPAKLAKGSNKGLAPESGLAETPRGTTDTTTLGWRSSCRCPAHEPAPATVLDPFSGSGTTVIEANALGRHGVGIELQAKYVAIAHQRLAGQPLSLFAHEAAAAG